uniref:Sodefrin-like factor n=1 Tax=Plectus sambesii TaxID=2011161 RepID=A0A914US20_9BILA
MMSTQLLSTSVTFGLLLALALTTAEAVRCKNCRNVDGTVRCDESCQGDVCVLWQWREKDIDHLIQGLVALPTVDCRNYVEAPFISPQSKETTCQANYCFFTQTHVSNFKGEMEMQTTANCGQLPQYSFDVQVASIWPGPGVIAGGCYLLQAKGQDTTLGCMCDTDSCNLDQPYEVVPGSVRCHLGYNIVSDSDSEQDATCTGDFCLIQKTAIPQFGVNYMKGCLSIGGSSAAKRSVQAGYRNILGVEQWLCKTDLCNKDIDTASAVDTADSRPASQTDSAPSLSSSIPTVFLVFVAAIVIFSTQTRS